MRPSARSRPSTPVPSSVLPRSVLPRRLLSDAAQGEALGDVVADEVDDEGAGDDGERAGGGEQAKLVARSAGGAGHGGGDRLGVDRGERLGEQQLDPGEYEAEERRHAHAGRDGGDEDADEESPEGIAVDEGRLVELLR